MNALDIILLILLVPSVIRGFIKGFLTQAVEFAALIFGAVFAYHVSRLLAPQSAILNVLLFIIILVAAFFGLCLLGKGLKKVIQVIISNGMDKLLGMVVGLLKAMLITGLLVIVFDTLNARFGFVANKVLNDSVLYGPVKDLTYFLFPYFKGLIAAI